MRPTPTPTLIAAMRVLSVEVQSDDGVATAAIAEASGRLESYHITLNAIRDALFRGDASLAHRLVMAELGP